MTDAEIVAEVAWMVKDAATQPTPADWVIEKLTMLAVTAAHLTVATAGSASVIDQDIRMLVIVLTAYKLGKRHGGLTLVVRDD